MTTTLPATKLRERLGTVLDQTTETKEPVYITRHGRTEAVLLDIDQYEALIRSSEAESASDEWYKVSQASLARIWEHPDEELYTLADGEPL
jgi:prevent-host-death family protein